MNPHIPATVKINAVYPCDGNLDLVHVNGIRLENGTSKPRPLSVSSASVESRRDTSDETEQEGYGTSTTDDTQRSSTAHQRPPHGPTSMEDIIRDSPFLDLSSPMTAYEWAKVVLMLPWVIFKVILSVSGLILVWAFTRVRLYTSQIRPLEQTSHE